MSIRAARGTATLAAAHAVQEFPPASLSPCAPRTAVRTDSQSVLLQNPLKPSPLRHSSFQLENYYLHQDLHAHPLHPGSRLGFCAGAPPSYLSAERAPPVAPTTAIHLRAAPVRLVSCNTLLGGCLLLRPPSSCPNRHEPFPFGRPSAPSTLARFNPLCAACLPGHAHSPRAPRASRFDVACRPRPTLAPSLTYARGRFQAAILRDLSEGTSH